MISLITTSAPRAAPARNRMSVITARPRADGNCANISAALIIANSAVAPAIYRHLLGVMPQPQQALCLPRALPSRHGKSVEGKPLKVSLFQAQLSGVARLFFGVAQTKICKGNDGSETDCEGLLRRGSAGHSGLCGPVVRG